MDTENTKKLANVTISENGTWISSTVKEKKSGLTSRYTKAISKMGKNKVKAFSNTQMDQSTTENTSTTTCTDAGILSGKTGENTVDSGKIKKCTEKGFSSGKITESTLETTFLIKNKAMESLFGQTDDAT